MARAFTVTKKPDEKHKDGSDREDKADRQWLAEVSDGSAVVDAAYFPTKSLAERWVRDVYQLL